MFLASLLLTGGMVADHFWGNGRGRQMSIPAGIAVSTLIGITIVLLHNLVYTRRQITINDEGIIAIGNAGTIVSVVSIPFSQMQAVCIQRASELQWPFGLLTVHASGKTALFGLKPSFDVSKLAQIFHDRNIAMEITDWRPQAKPPATRRDAPTLDEVQASAPQTFASIQVKSVQDPDGKRVLSRFNVMVFNAIGLVPSGILVLASICVGIYAFWFRKTLESAQLVTLVVGGLAPVYRDRCIGLIGGVVRELICPPRSSKPLTIPPRCVGQPRRLVGSFCRYHSALQLEQNA